MQQLGPGMIQQIQSMCPDCQGQGEKFNSKDRCKNCNGHKVERKKKILEVHVDKGKPFPLIRDSHIKISSPPETNLTNDASAVQV